MTEYWKLHQILHYMLPLGTGRHFWKSTQDVFMPKIVDNMKYRVRVKIRHKVGMMLCYSCQVVSKWENAITFLNCVFV